MDKKWVSTWGQSHISMHVFTPRAKNRTMRFCIENNLDGEKIRLQISNSTGSKSMEIGQVAVRCDGEKRIITFDKEKSVVLAPKEERYSDELELPVRAGSKIETSIYFMGNYEPLSGNALAETIQYSEKGDFVEVDYMTEVADRSIMSKKFNLMVPIKAISSIEIFAATNTKSMVVFGDSITQQGNWTTPFIHKLYKEYPGQISIINKGIGGNRLLTDGTGAFQMFGKAAINRFDRDVLREAGVSGVILALGSNDLGQPKDENDPYWRTAEQLIQGLERLAKDAKAFGLCVFAVTITPRAGCTVDYWSEERETIRLQVNDWIRTSELFEEVFDFDKAIACRQDPSRMEFRYDSGDHLHPNRFGGEAMAEIISLEKINKMIRQ